jgi:hypothetical protein
MRTSFLWLAGLAVWACSWAGSGATTLQKLSLDDMIHQSTGIVRGKVIGSRAGLRGQNIYTYYRLHVLEAEKAVRAGKDIAGEDIEVAVPGGTANGMRQVAIGSPELTAGSEYVVFLWTGKSGLTQIIGLSQGLFLAVRDASGRINLSRPATDELMVDRSGHQVPAEALGLEWSAVRARIRKELQK